MPLSNRWSPSRELERLRQQLDDVLERVSFEGGGLFKEWHSSSLRPAVESYVDGHNFVVRVELPGVDPKDVEIKVVRGALTIKGVREEKHESKKRDFFRREFHYGTFQRSFQLPEGLKAEDLKATYKDGVLELTASMPKEALPKEVKVEIQSGKTKESAGDKRAA